MSSLYEIMQRVLPPSITRLAGLARTVGVALVLLPYGYLVSSGLHLPPIARLAASLAVAFAVGTLLVALLKRAWRWCSVSMSANSMPTHRAADRQLSLSHLESIIAAGRHDDATAEIERMLTAHGVSDEGFCRLAVDFRLRTGGDMAPAEALLRRMRREMPAAYEAFATQRLVDLYLRDPATAARAIPELRRLAARVPGTPEGDGALAAATRLRSLVQAATI